MSLLVLDIFDLGNNFEVRRFCVKSRSVATFLENLEVSKCQKNPDIDILNLTVILSLIFTKQNIFYI